MSLYSDLRQRGEVVVSHDDRWMINHARVLAKRDGLQIVASRGPSKHLSKSQARVRPFTVALVHPSDPTTIIAPDGEVARP